MTATAQPADWEHDNSSRVARLQGKARIIREQIVRGARIIPSTVHLGGPLSATDVVVALYYEFLGFDIENLQDPDRNRFILSKGHNGILLYNVLADLGLYDFTDIFEGYNRPNHPFGMHPNRNYIKGVEASTGSLGHGLSLGLGMAIATAGEGRTSRVFVMTGDGEMEEGSNWEALMYAGSHHVSNLVNILDFNGGTVAFDRGENMTVDWRQAYEAFGWDVLEINGNDMREVVAAFDSLPAVGSSDSKNPIAIISHTQKGYGVDFMSESASRWHLGSIDDELLERALASIEANYREGMI